MSGIGAAFGSYASGFLGSLGSGIGSGVVNDMFGESLDDRQRYALEQMEKQAELNRKQYEQQFKDQLRVSDPAFIRSRLEGAGLSPSLALSGGAMSPGLNTSISGVSTPSAPSNGLKMASFGNVAESAARIRNLDADTESKQTDTDYLRKSMQTRLDILSEEKLSKYYANNIARIDSLYKEDITIATLDKLKREMDAISFDMANRKELTDIERQKLAGYLQSLTHQYALWQSQIGLNDAKTTTEGTVQELNQAKTAELNSRVDLNEAQTLLSNASREEVYSRISKYEKEKDKIDAEIVRIGKENKLTDQHIREIKNNIALRWAVFGVNTATSISSEVRKWINPLSSIADLKRDNRALRDLLDDNDLFFAD